MNENTKNSVSVRAGLKERIVATAIDSFYKHGIKNITMDDIAARLSISKRTLYETFKDKESLLMECVLQRQKEVEAYMMEVISESENVLEVILKFYKKSIEIYHRTNKQYFEDMKKYPRVNEMIKKMRNENSESAIEFFRKGVEQGMFRNDVNFEIIQLLVREQVSLLMETDLCNAYSFVDVYESIMFVFMRGVSTEKGRKILDDFIKEYRKHE